MIQLNTIWVLLFLLSFFNLSAQHEPQSWIFGAQLNTNIAAVQNVGGTLQINYAHNCYTTYIGELSLLQYKNDFVPEIGISANLIINNFKQYNWILTGGFGLGLTSVSLEKEELEDAFLVFSNEDIHLNALLKLRALYKFTNSWSFVGEFNLKTLGIDFSTLSIGLNYEIPL